MSKILICPSVSGNRVVMKMSGPKMEKVTGDCKKLYNERFYDLYTVEQIL